MIIEENKAVLSRIASVMSNRTGFHIISRDVVCICKNYRTKIYTANPKDNHTILCCENGGHYTIKEVHWPFI